MRRLIYCLTGTALQPSCENDHRLWSTSTSIGILYVFQILRSENPLIFLHRFRYRVLIASLPLLLPPDTFVSLLPLSKTLVSVSSLIEIPAPRLPDSWTSFAHSLSSVSETCDIFYILHESLGRETLIVYTVTEHRVVISTYSLTSAPRGPRAMRRRPHTNPQRSRRWRLRFTLLTRSVLNALMHLQLSLNTYT